MVGLDALSLVRARNKPKRETSCRVVAYTRNSQWAPGRILRRYLLYTIINLRGKETGRRARATDPYPNARLSTLRQFLTHRQVPNAQFFALEVLALKCQDCIANE